MTLEIVETAAAERNLAVLGGFHPTEEDTDLKEFGTVVLLGPSEPEFWARFTNAPEWLDGKENPIDRWSSRVVTDLAVVLGARPFFPFGGPPYRPFYQWALRSGRCHASPINLLVHDTAGLFVSFRGALGITERIDLLDAPPSPCKTCADKPCLTACPVNAYASGQYEVPVCTAEIRGRDAADCANHGCGARRACPVSQSYGRVPVQSAYHMQVFLKNAP